MTQLIHWNPFKPLANIDAPASVDEFFRSFGLRPAWRDLDVLPEIRIDVNEDETSYKVKADIPGMKKEDIEISVDGRQVAISAETKHKKEKSTASSLYTERTEGRVCRSFTLPKEVDGKTAEARYEAGVLSLMLPKKPNGNNHRIAIS
jgi:HSP20 family protein